MAPRWADSAAKHAVSRADAVYAVLHATYTDDLIDEAAGPGVIRLFIGPRHAQALPVNEIEVLVREFPADPGRQAVIFHVMPLGAKFRRYRQENPR